jgi:hypothetical protein
MLPAWCSAGCCPLAEVCVPFESVSALFAVWSIGGCLDHAGKLQSSTGRLSQTTFPRPRIKFFLAQPTDISCFPLPSIQGRLISMLLRPLEVQTCYAARSSGYSEEVAAELWSRQGFDTSSFWQRLTELGRLRFDRSKLFELRDSRSKSLSYI